MTYKDPKLIVALYLRGEHLDPDLVTQRVGIEPSKMHKKGDTHVTSTGHKVTAKHGLWALVIEVDSLSLDDHLLRLEGSLPPDLSPSSIGGVEDAYFDVFVAMTSDADGDAECELEVSPKLLALLASFGLPVRITVTSGRD